MEPKRIFLIGGGGEYLKRLTDAIYEVIGREHVELSWFDHDGLPLSLINMARPESVVIFANQCIGRANCIGIAMSIRRHERHHINIIGTCDPNNPEATAQEWSGVLADCIDVLLPVGSRAHYGAIAEWLAHCTIPVLRRTCRTRTTTAPGSTHRAWGVIIFRSRLVDDEQDNRDDDRPDKDRHERDDRDTVRRSCLCFYLLCSGFFHMLGFVHQYQGLYPDFTVLSTSKECGRSVRAPDKLHFDVLVPGQN